MDQKISFLESFSKAFGLTRSFEKLEDCLDLIDAILEEQSEQWGKEFRQIFPVIHQGTQKAFCRQFELNQDNFSKWLRGRRENPKAALAVARLVKQRLLNEIAEKKRNEILKNLPVPVRTAKQILSYLRDSRVDLLFMINGDDCGSDSVKEILHTLLEKAKRGSPRVFHAILFLQKGREIEGISEIGQQKWFSLVYPHKKFSQSVIAQFISLASYLNVLMKPDTKFVLIADNVILQELERDMADFGTRDPEKKIRAQNLSHCQKKEIKIPDLIEKEFIEFC